MQQMTELQQIGLERHTQKIIKKNPILLFCTENESNKIFKKKKKIILLAFPMLSIYYYKLFKSNEYQKKKKNM